MRETEVIGTAIKTLRKQLNMTLADLASATGFSISYLSKIERNQGSITLDAIAKICSAFEIDVVNFLSLDFNKDTVHIRKEDRRVILHRESSIKYELLTRGQMKKIRGLLITLYPNNNEGYARIASPHTTDEFAFILEGEMILAVVDKNGNTKENILKKGDSFYLYAGHKHALKCHGNKECISIWSYLAPPCFPEDIPSQH